MYRSGGFAGMVLGWEIDVDRQPDRDSWAALVDACPWEQTMRASLVGSNGNDRFVYRFKAGRRSVTIGESNLDGPWRQLADRLRAAGRRLPAAEVALVPAIA